MRGRGGTLTAPACLTGKKMRYSALNVNPWLLAYTWA